MKHLILTERSAFSKPSNIRMTCKRKIDDEFKAQVDQDLHALEQQGASAKYDGKCGKMYSKLECMQA